MSVRNAVRLGTAVVVLLFPLRATAQAAEHLDAAAEVRVVTPFVEKETTAVAHADFSRLPVATIAARLTDIRPEVAADLRENLAIAAGGLEALRRGGRASRARACFTRFPTRHGLQASRITLCRSIASNSLFQ